MPDDLDRPPGGLGRPPDAQDGPPDAQDGPPGEQDRSPDGTAAGGAYEARVRERRADSQERQADTEERRADSQERLAETEERSADTEERQADTGEQLPPEARAQPAASPEARARHRLRFTRRRILVLGGAAAAAAAAALAGLRPWAGSRSDVANDRAGGGVELLDGSDPFPTLNVEPPPGRPAEDWVLKIDGLVERPLTIDRASWSRLARVDFTADFHCVTGWTAEDVRWGGVAPAVLLDQAGLLPEARYAAFHAYRHEGEEYLSSVPLDLLRAPDSLLADTLDGRDLPREHGGPLRLVVSRQYGYKSVKWVVRIEVTAESRRGYWEQRGYADDAPVRGG